MGQSNSQAPKNKAAAVDTLKLPSPIPSGSLRRRQWKLGTIRKKIVKTFHPTKCPSYKKYIREMILTWEIKDLSTLVQKYDYLSTFKEVLVEANRARPVANSLQKDLVILFKQQYCSDVLLIYKDFHYPVHRAILACRCPYFAKKLQRNSQINEPLTVDDDLSFMETLDTNTVEFLLRFVYTGDMNVFDSQEMEDIYFKLVTKEYGTGKSLEADFKALLESCNMTDVILVFKSSELEKHENLNEVDLTDDVNIEFSCHASILCARSNYFCSLLTKVWRAKEPMRKNSSQLMPIPIKIPIDESVIPRQYAQVILHCMYTDCVDLHAVIKWRSSDESSNGPGETDRLLTTTEIAMELYEIGQFLEFPILCQGCENVIVEDFSVQTVLSALEWSSQPHGSSWVQRQAMLYLHNEFLNLLKSNTLLSNLPKKYLLELLKSDYLEASEEDVLSLVLRWGELQITKTNSKDRQNGSLTNSLNRRSPKRRDVSDSSLYDAVQDCLCYIRVNHILPPNSIVLQYAYKRGLFQRPKPPDITECDQASACSASAALAKTQRQKEAWLTCRPRLFQPFYEEAKAVLFERMLADMNIAQIRPLKSKSMPDMLSGARAGDRSSLSQMPSGFSHHSFLLQATSVDSEVLRKIKSREQELRTCNLVQRALALPEDCSQIINIEIQKWVLREMGLPDCLAMETHRQAPDLIEESSSSTGSSRESTLSKTTNAGYGTLGSGAPDVTMAGNFTWERD